jgi:hypothetical protein
VSNRLVRQGKTWHEYKICLHAGNHGEATKVRFGPRDRWVGDDYWYHVKSYEPSRKQRAFLLMSKMENRGQTSLPRYELIRKILYKELGYGPNVSN